eukprot:TRINITY_DN108297_c0_g1_i1.p1 TRINITY_DN108297_c0_g1~~TRINITY_DN108297_c0_g1_i1.p1  ORF type:complete len:476 (+),score=64.47 TRINITY_DN108297_c0_g1_i1:90-1517(+)
MASPFRGAAFVILLLCGTWHVNGADTSCEADYARSDSAYIRNSGGQPVFRRVFDATTAEGMTRLKTLFEKANSDVVLCTESGSRSWEVEFNYATYLSRLEALDGRSAQIASSLRSLMPGNFDPTPMMGIFCAPSSCNNVTAGAVAIRNLLAYHLRVSPELLQAPNPGTEVMRAEELAPWSEVVGLDFTVAGLARCGTTSLQRNLGKHADITFTRESEEEYSLLGLSTSSRFVPLKSQVTEWNAQLRKLRGGARILGLKNPGIVDEPMNYLRLAMMPSVRMVVVVCDPLSRLDRMFDWLHACHENMEAAMQAHKIAITPQKKRGECKSSIGSVLTKKLKPFYLHYLESRPRLDQFLQLFKERLFLFHQERLRQAPQELYDRLALFLGQRKFPPGTDFRRYHVRSGQRTDLCKSNGTMRALKRALSDQYRVFEGALSFMGQAIPAQLRLRQSRCDRPTDLRQPSCDVKESFDHGCPS